MLQKWFEETQGHYWGQTPKGQDLEDFGSSREKLLYQLWNVGKYGNCVDAAITGIMPPPLMEAQVKTLARSYFIMFPIITTLFFYLLHL